MQSKFLWFHLLWVRAVAVAVDVLSAMDTQRQSGDTRPGLELCWPRGTSVARLGLPWVTKDRLPCLALGTSVVMGFFKSDSAGAQLEELPCRMNVF